jgi:hypothetical protein
MFPKYTRINFFCGYPPFFHGCRKVLKTIRADIAREAIQFLCSSVSFVVNPTTTTIAFFLLM